MANEQCEGCLGYTEDGLTLLCNECVEKAASYDITLRDKTQLANTIKQAIKCTDGSVKGSLRAALACCDIAEIEK